MCHLVVKSGGFALQMPQKSVEMEVRNLFGGEYNHSVDAKGRVIMPSKFRETLGNKFWITRGLDKNLTVYSCDEWQKVYEKISTLPFVDRNSRALSRLLLSGCSECEVDKQGRILIPQSLRTYAGIDKDVTVIGNGNKVEIWNTDTWNDYIAELDADQAASNLCELGIMI